MTYYLRLLGVGLLMIGATQHYAIVDGDWRKELEDFAEIMGFEFYNIK